MKELRKYVRYADLYMSSHKCNDIQCVTSYLFAYIMNLLLAHLYEADGLLDGILKYTSIT